MKRLDFLDIEDFVSEIQDTYESLEEDNYGIQIIAKYDEAKEIIKELIMYGHDVMNIEIEDTELANYLDEFAITLTYDSIWFEKAKNKKGGYLNIIGSVIYILDNCNSKVISHCQSPVILEVGIGDDEEDFTECPYTYDCADCIHCEENTGLSNSDETTYIYRLKDGTPRGFEKSWSGFTEDGIFCESNYRYFSSNAEELIDLAEKFGIKL